MLESVLTTRGARGLCLAYACIVGLWAVGWGCKTEPCKTAPPTVTVRVRLDKGARPANVRWLRVDLGAGESTWRRLFPAEGSLLDGEATFAVAIDPRPEGAFSVRVRVEAVDSDAASAQVLYEGEASSDATPDGCNEIEVILRDPKEHGDAGPSDTPVIAADAAPDSGVAIEDGAHDAAADDAATNDATTSDATTNDRFSGDITTPDVGQSSPHIVFLELQDRTFVVDGRITVTAEVRDANGNRVNTDNTTDITFDPSLGGTIVAVNEGTGDGRYGLLGGVERVRVLNGRAQIELTDLAVETFEIAITNSVAYLDPPKHRITVLPGPALIAWWKCDEPAALGRLFDASGHGHTATITGVAARTSGIDGPALVLSGTDNFAEASGLLGQPSTVTVMAWVQLSGADALGAEVVSLGHHIRLVLDSVEGLAGGFWQGAELRTTRFGAKYAGTGWHHVAYAYGPVGRLQKLYLDGELVSNTRFRAPLSYLGLGSNTRIGAHGNGGGSYDFGGNIDDVRVYGRALTDAEVAGIYTQFSGLIGHWALDDGSGTIAHDLSPYGRDGTLMNGANWTSGFPTAVTLDGNNDFVEVQGVGESPRNLTIAGWANLTLADSSGSRVIDFRAAIDVTMDAPVSKGAVGQFQGPFRQVETPSGRFLAGSGWHHLAFSVDDDGNQTDLHIDGGATTRGSTQSIAYDPLVRRIRLGRDAGPFGGVMFAGKISDVRVYDRALHPAAIKRLIGRPSGLIGHWTFDEGAGTTASDSSGLRLDGTITGATWNASGAPGHGGALSFDGSGDVVTIGSFTLDSFSVAAWFYKTALDSVAEDGVIWAQARNTDAQLREGFTLHFSNATPDRLQFIVHLEDPNTGIRSITVAEHPVSNLLNTWHHFVGTYDSATGVQRLYVDGVLQSSSNYTPGHVAVGLVSRSTIEIGRSGAPEYTFNGKIDDVRIYNRALSQTEVTAIFTGTSAP